MRTRRALVAGPVLLLALFASTPAVSGAVSASGLGWWTRSPGASPPADGFEVASAPDGAVSVAAFHVAGDRSRVTHAVLVLTEAGGASANQGGAALQVCRTPNSFTPGPKQTFANAPKAECGSGRAPLARNASTATWAADVTALVASYGDSSSTVALMILPADPPPAPAAPAVFQIDFAAPSLLVEERPATTTQDSAVPFDSGSSSFDNSTGSSSNFGSEFSSSNFTTSPSSPAEPTGTPAVTPPYSDASVTKDVAPAIAAPIRRASTSRGPTPWGKGVVLVLISAVVGVLAGVGRHRFAPTG